MRATLYEELMAAFSAGYKVAKFGVWLVRDVEEGGDAEGDVKYVAVDVAGTSGGREMVEVCDCRACMCECFEEQVFGVEGRIAARSEEEVKKFVGAVAEIMRLNYGGGFERHVEELRRLGFDVITLVPKPDAECPLEDW